MVQEVFDENIFSRLVQDALNASFSKALSLKDEEALEQKRTSLWQEVERYAWKDSGGAFQTLVKLIKQYGRQSQGEQAEMLAAKALSLKAHDPFLLAFLAKRYLERALYPQALQLLENIPEEKGYEFQRDLLLGKAAWRIGDLEKARAAFYRIASSHQHVDIESIKGALEFFRTEHDRTALRMLLQTVTQEAQGAKDDPEICLWMAEWLLEDQDDEEAEVWLTRAQGQLDKGSNLYWQAWRLLFQRQHPEEEKAYRSLTAGIFQRPAEESLKKLEDLVKTYPDFWEAWYFLGTCYRRLGKNKLAIRCFEKVLEFFDYPNAWLELGALYGEQRKPHKALKASLKAQEHLGEENHVIWCNLAAAYFESGQETQGKEALMRAEKLQPTSKGLIRLKEYLSKEEHKPKGFFARLFS